MSVDPHESRYPDWSPFAYAADNPLAVVDFSGMDTNQVKPPPAPPPPPTGASIVIPLVGVPVVVDVGALLQVAKATLSKVDPLSILVFLAVTDISDAKPTDAKWLSEANKPKENADVKGGTVQGVDGDGKAIPADQLTPTGEVKREPSTKAGNRDGGVSVQEGYLDPNGKPVTKHTVYDKNGNIVNEPHFRPGGFK